MVLLVFCSLGCDFGRGVAETHHAHIAHTILQTIATRRRSYVCMQATATEQRHLSYIKSGCGNLDVLRHSPNALQPAPSLSCRVENQRQQGTAGDLKDWAFYWTTYWFACFRDTAVVQQTDTCRFCQLFCPCLCPCICPCRPLCLSLLLAGGFLRKPQSRGLRRENPWGGAARFTAAKKNSLRTAATIAADKKDRAVGP